MFLAETSREICFPPVSPQDINHQRGNPILLFMSTLSTPSYCEQLSNFAILSINNQATNARIRGAKIIPARDTNPFRRRRPLSHRNRTTAVLADRNDPTYPLNRAAAYPKLSKYVSTGTRGKNRPFADFGTFLCCEQMRGCRAGLYDCDLARCY